MRAAEGVGAHPAVDDAPYFTIPVSLVLARFSSSLCGVRPYHSSVKGLPWPHVLRAKRAAFLRGAFAPL
jgi:hypothetical protein